MEPKSNTEHSTEAESNPLTRKIPVREGKATPWRLGTRSALICDASSNPSVNASNLKKKRKKFKHINKTM